MVLIGFLKCLTKKMSILLILHVIILFLPFHREVRHLQVVGIVV